MAEISNLDIRITASADEATRALNRLTSAANNLHGAAGGAAGGMQNMAGGARDMGTATQNAGTQSGRARSNIRGVGRDAQEAGNNAKKGASGLATFWQSLKRIAYYRMIRSIIKSIGQAFKEGAQNLYQWSAANSSLSDFKKNMDRIATSALYLKNSLGAMLEPIVRTLAPIIEAVVDGLVWIINHVNMLFAALSGSQTYTVAKKVATTWGDAASDVASSTHNAAEDIKRTLLGFDEINKLEKPNTSSYSNGSGSGNNNPNYSDMFEERQLDGWMAVLAKFIDDTKTAIPAVIAGLLVPFEAIKKVIEGIVEKTKEWLQDLGALGSLIIEVPVSLIRSGWTTITNWVASFGAAAIDVVVSLTTASALWNGLKKAWDAISDKTLSVGISITTTAANLWKSIQSAWGNATNYVLNVTASIVTTATSLWNGLQTAWGSISNHVLSVYLDLATTASSLWTSLQTAWGSIPNHVLNVYLDLATTASSLWTSLQVAWGSLSDKALSVYLDLATTAASLWTKLQTAWGAITNHVLSVYLDLATSAQSLWTTLQTAWGSLTNKALSVYLDLATTAQSLWTKLQTAWGSIPNHVLNVYLSIVTGVETLWSDLSAAWGEAKDRVLDVAISTAENIKTAVDNVWKWVKDNWTTLAAGALGIAVAILTPWETIAAALGGLWADVMASFGGSLAFGVTPTFGGLKTPGQVSDELGDAKKPLSELFTEEDYNIYVNAQINATPGTGISSVGADGKLNLKGVNGANTAISASAGKGISSISNDGKLNLNGVNNTSTKINASAGTGISSFDKDGKVNLVGVNCATAQINGTPGTGFTGKLSGTNTYTLKGINDASAKVNATAGTGLSYSGSWKLSNSSLGNAAIKVGLDSDSSPIAKQVLDSGKFTKYVQLGFEVIGAAATSGEIMISEEGVTEGTASILNLISAFNKLKDGASKKLKVGVVANGTPDATTSRALAFKSGTSKTAKFKIADAGGSSTTVKNAVNAPASDNKVISVALGTNKDKSDTAAVAAFANAGKTLKSAVNVTLKVVKGAADSILQFLGLKKALGGVFSNGLWSNIPQYAGGTLNAHGSLFLAGEAGPEIVGHVGGRTEVLNKSQLASAMYSAVRSAMSGVTLNTNFYGSSNDSEADYDMMYRAMYDAFSAVMARGEERDREKVALLRSINEKDYNLEITASSLARGMSRMNRRAGITVVPTGT